MKERTIGFVGLDAMGARIADRLLKRGYDVLGTDALGPAPTELIEHGLGWRDTAREVAESSDVIFNTVTHDDVLRLVTGSPHGVLAGLTPGSVYIDMSRVSPSTSRELAERVRAVGAEMLDAPVSGDESAAADGQLVIIVGGSSHVVRFVLPILDELGSVMRVGPNGQGLLMRLAIDAAVAVQMVSFSEAVLLAERAGVDRSLAVRAVIQSSAGSLLLKNRGPFVLGLPKNTSLDVGRLLDGLELALDTAGALEVPLPTTAIARELFATARAMGYEDQDIAVVYEVLAEIVNSP